MRVADVMSKNIKSVNKEATILDVMKLMRNDDVGFVIIIEDNKPLGIITDRDILLILAKELSTSTNICKVMKKYIISIHQNDDIGTASDTMGIMQVRRLVVLDDFNNVVGVIGLSDIARNSFCEEYALSALIEISYDYSTKKESPLQISAYIF